MCSPREQGIFKSSTDVANTSLYSSNMFYNLSFVVLSTCAIGKNSILVDFNG